MLNFTTTTIINDITNVLCGDSSNNVYNANDTSTAIMTSASPNDDGKFLSVKFGPKLFNNNNNIKLAGKQAYTAAVPATATVEIPSASGIYRIAMYIRLRNNNNPYFYNNWTFKGRPLYIEFNGGDTPDNIIAKAKKYMIAEYGYNLVKFSTGNYTQAQADAYNATLQGHLSSGGSVDTTLATALNGISGMSTTYTNGDTITNANDINLYNATLAGAVSTSTSNPSNLVITAVDQWEIFMDQDSNSGVKIQVLKEVDSAGNIVVGTSNLPTHEEFVPYTSGYVYVDNGNEAFGDFAHIVKDLRLPTAANRRWQGIAEGDVFGGEPNDDKPMPNGHYTQYTLQYTVERGVLQQTALGGVGTSRTVHVFYVESAATTKFEKALNKAGIIAGTSVQDTDISANLV